MYLKVNNGDKVYYYKFEDGQKVTIGRGSQNDIALNAEGVSRNHIVIHSQDGNYKVEDLGATNGTFINEERLETNTPTPFNTFFPVQLGFHAKVHLVDESQSTSALDKLVEETQQELDSQATKITKL